MTGTGALTFSDGTVTLPATRTVTVNAPTFTVGGTIVGNFGLTKAGTGIFALNAANTFSGTTRVNAGTLRLDNALALQNSGVDTSGAGGIAATTTSLTLGGLIGSGNVSSVITSGYSAVTELTLNPQSGSYTYSGVIGNGASGMTLRKTGSGTQVLAGNNTFTGQTTIAEGALEVSQILSSGNSPLGQASQVNVGGASANAGILRYTGAGESTSRVFNLLASGTGGIEANGTGPLVITSTVTAAGGGVFRLLGTNTGTNQIRKIGGLGVSVEKDGPGTWWFTGDSDFDGEFRALAGSAIVSADVLGENSSPLGVGAVTVGGPAASGEARLLLSDAMISRLVTVASGAGQRVLLGTAENATSGTFAGDLALNREVTLVAPLSGTAVFGGFVDATTNIRVGHTDFRGTVALASFPKATSGTVSVDFGRLRVEEESSLSAGSVNINGGELNFNSSTPLTSPITFTSGILSGTGTIDTAVNVGAGNTISPGNSPGIQTYASSVWSPDGTYRWELNALTGAAGTNWDQVIVTSLLNLTGLSVENKFNLDLATMTGSNLPGQLDSPYVSGESYTFPFLSFGSLSVSGTFSNAADSDLTSLFNIMLDNWQGTKPAVGDISVKVNSGGTGLDLVIVPEPTTIALAGIGIGTAVWCLRRRRRS